MSIVASASTCMLHPPSRFAWLMGLYAENYCRLARLIDLDRLLRGERSAHVSSVGDGLDVYWQLLARHRYTLELRMSYTFADPLTGQPDPNAHIRIYTDARQAEVTHCYVGRRWQDLLGNHPPASTLFAHRLRMNTFLSKWLEHLQHHGHGQLVELTDLRPLAAPIDG